MKAFIKEAGERLQAETPVFFKKLANVGASVAATGGAIITPEIAGANMPHALVHIALGMVAFGAGLKAASHFGAMFDTSGPSDNSQPPKP